MIKRDLTNDQSERSQNPNRTRPGESGVRGCCSRIGDAFSRRLWLLDNKNLCAEAQRRTRLVDFGSPPIEPALSLLTQSLESEANLHPLGRFLMHFHLRGLLETRLRLAELWGSQPGNLGSSPIRRPIFVTGMPRSGSTFLHELLSEDPDNRAPRVWEVMFPIPNRKAESGRRDPRVGRAEMCLWWFRRFAPQADAVFPMRAQTPHECVAIQSYTFLSEEFVSTCRIPAYETFLRKADLRPAYEWERRFLQHLQNGCLPRQWVLKSPDHVHSLDELFAVFPDALVINTHRNPLEVLKSSSQLTQVLQGLYGRPVSPETIMARESRVLAESVEEFIHFRDQHPELDDRFIDVRYTDLVADPLSVVQSIYQRFELPLTNVAADRMRHLASTRSRYAKPRELSASPELRDHVPAEASRFERYCARFGIAWQRPVLR